MIKAVAPITGYLNEFNRAVSNGQMPPSMEGRLSGPQAARVEKFLILADPQGLAYRFERPDESVIVASSEPQAEASSERFAIGDANATRLREILGNLAVPDTAISTQPQQGEQQ